MKRAIYVAGCICLAMAVVTTPAAAKKKKKKGLGPVVTATATSSPSTGANQHLSATATCPGKKRAIGGGFATEFVSTGNGIVVFESVRSGAKTWTVKGATAGAASAGKTILAFAYCRRLTKPLLDVAGTAPLAPGTGLVGTAVAACPGSKRKLVSGGFSSNVGPTPAAIGIPHVSAMNGAVWTYSAISNTSGAQSLTAHAYCAKKLKAPAVRSTTTTQATATNATITAATPPCPAKRLLTAGGFAGQAPVLAGPIPIVTESRIVGSSWQVTERNINTAGTIPLTAQGLCL